MAELNPLKDSTTGLNHLSHYSDSDSQEEPSYILKDKDGQHTVDGPEDSKDHRNIRASYVENDEASTSECLSPEANARAVYTRFFSNVQLPPTPPPPHNGEELEEYNHLQKRVIVNIEKLSRGMNPIDYIKNSKSFKNPSIYEKLVSYCGLVEYASNHDKTVFDPTYFDMDEGNYITLASKQTDAYKRSKDRTGSPSTLSRILKDPKKLGADRLPHDKKSHHYSRRAHDRRRRYHYD